MKTQLVIDLRAVSHARFWWQTRDGSIARRCKPKQPSVNGIIFKPNSQARSHPFYPLETNMERAVRLNVLDRWCPMCRFQLKNSHSLLFAGEEAKKRWKEYNAHIYGK